MHHKTSKFWLILSVAIGVIVVVIGIEQYYRLYVSNVESRDDEAHLIYVYPETSMDSLWNVLQADYQIASPLNWRFHCKLLRFTKPKVGCYTIGAREGDLAVIRRLRGGMQTPVQVTFNHIRTREQLAKRLSEQLLVDSASVVQRLEDSAYMARYELNKETAVTLFIPDTYDMFWNISADHLFERMAEAYRAFWTPAREAKAQALGLSKAEVATIASIAEEETNKEFEYPIIAGLYLNRLQKGMALQACPTVKFAMQDFKLRRILYEHLQYDSPYNTYKYKGLPPGPIRIPRASTMDAVLNRDKNPYLYMCASADFNGTHHFSTTYAEHARYARAYQAELNRRKIR